MPYYSDDEKSVTARKWWPYFKYGTMTVLLTVTGFLVLSALLR